MPPDPWDVGSDLARAGIRRFVSRTSRPDKRPTLSLPVAEIARRPARHHRTSSILGRDDCRETGVPVKPLKELRTLVAKERVAAIVAPENPRRGVAPCAVEAAGTVADRPGC